MGTFVLQSGPFGILALLLGFVGLLLALAAGRSSSPSRLARLASGAALASLLVGAGGTALGVHLASQAVLAQVDPAPSMWLAGLGTAVTPTVLAAASALAILGTLGLTRGGSGQAEPAPRLDV